MGNPKTEGCFYKELTKCGDNSIIGSVTPVNTPTHELTQTFVINEETHQNIPNKFEGKPFAALESYIYNTEEPEYTTQWSRGR